MTYGHKMDQRWQWLSEPETQAELSHEKGRCGRSPYSPASHPGHVPTTTGGEQGSPRSWGVSGQDWGWGRVTGVGGWGTERGAVQRGAPDVCVQVPWSLGYCPHAGRLLKAETEQREGASVWRPLGFPLSPDGISWKTKKVMSSEEGPDRIRSKSVLYEINCFREQRRKGRLSDLKTDNRSYYHWRTLWEGLKKTEENFSHCRTIPT